MEYIDAEQAITWNNVNQDPCRHLASLCHNQLGINYEFGPNRNDEWPCLPQETLIITNLHV